jgi:hypothetical protein
VIRYVLAVLQVLAALQLRMPLYPVKCPVCGASYMSISASDAPCSSVCTGKAARDRTMGSGTVHDPANVPDPKQRPDRGRHSSGKTAPQKSGVKAGKTPAGGAPANDGCGGCALIALGSLTAAAGGAAWGLYELASTVLA